MAVIDGGGRVHRFAPGSGGREAVQQPAVWLVAAFATGIGGYFGLSWEPNWPELAALLLPAGAAWLGARMGWPLRWAGVVLFALGLGLIAAKARTDLQWAPVWPEGPPRAATVTGTILAVEYRDKGRARLLVKVGAITPARTVPARVLVTLRDRAALRMAGSDDPGTALGRFVTFRARLSAPRPALRPGGYDPARQAFFSQIGAYGFVLSAIKPAVPDDGPAPELSRAERFWLWAEAQRRAIADAIIAALPGAPGTIAAALVTGLRGEIDDATIADLRASGLAHILSISGLHMVLMAGSVFWAVRAGLAAIAWVALAWPVKQIAAGVALLAATAYLALSGAAVPAERAYIMTGVALVAVLLGRRAISLRNVALAAGLALARRPEALLEPGFQMSFAAATALVAGYQSWSAWRGDRAGNPASVWRGPAGHQRVVAAGRAAGSYMAGIVGSTLIASAAIGPFGAYHFHTFSSFSVLANALALPLVGLIIMPGLLIGVLLLPFGAADWPLWAVGEALDHMMAIAAWVSDLGGAVLHVPTFSAWALALMTIGGMWFLCWQGRLRLAGLVPAAIGVAAAIAEPQPALRISPDGRMVALACTTMDTLPGLPSDGPTGTPNQYPSPPDGLSPIAPCRGLAVSAIGQPDRFVRDVWTKAMGQPPDDGGRDDAPPDDATSADAPKTQPAQPVDTQANATIAAPSSPPGWRCDALGCVATIGSLTIMHAHARQALAECQRVDVVIAPFAVSRRACPDPILRVDARALRRGGAHELHVQPNPLSAASWFHLSAADRAAPAIVVRSARPVLDPGQSANPIRVPRPWWPAERPRRTERPDEAPKPQSER